jgi:hypothetical protein
MTPVFFLTLLLPFSDFFFDAAPASDAENTWGYQSAWREGEHCEAEILQARDRMRSELKSLGERYRGEAQNELDDLVRRHASPLLADCGP